MVNPGCFYMVKRKGIDVSYWNGHLTENQYRRLKEGGVEFVIARAGGYRGAMADSTFANNYRRSKAAGLGFGAYYYSTAMTPAQARVEAHHAVALCRGKRFDYPIWMDVEDVATQGQLGKASLTRIIKAFVSEVKRLGRKAGVYASYDWLTSKIGDLSGIDVWVAQYNDTNDYSGRTAMWQYSSSGRFMGVPGRFDLNWCYRDYTRGNGAAGKETYPGLLRLPPRGYFAPWDRGPNVRQLQRFLNWWGVYLEVDGIYGPLTTDAVRKFQRRYGLAVDGLFGRKSLEQARKVKR